MLAAVLASFADVPLVSFDGPIPLSKFVQLNDPVMGGRSSGSWSVDAAGIRRSTCSGAEAAYAVRGCDDQPAPDPARSGRAGRAASTARLTRLLLSSDLLRVAAWVVVGLCLGSGFALVVGSLFVSGLEKLFRASCGGGTCAASGGSPGAAGGLARW